MNQIVSDHGRSGGEGAVGGVIERLGLGVDKINMLVQTSIGVLRIEGASLDPPYISILESRKASDLNACYRESTVADKGGPNLLKTGMGVGCGMLGFN